VARLDERWRSKRDEDSLPVHANSLARLHGRRPLRHARRLLEGRSFAAVPAAGLPAAAPGGLSAAGLPAAAPGGLSAAAAARLSAAAAARLSAAAAACLSAAAAARSAGAVELGPGVVPRHPRASGHPRDADGHAERDAERDPVPARAAVTGVTQGPLDDAERDDSGRDRAPRCSGVSHAARRLRHTAR
jgi:hypothetical protein